MVAGGCLITHSSPNSLINKQQISGFTLASHSATFDFYTMSPKSSKRTQSPRRSSSLSMCGPNSQLQIVCSYLFMSLSKVWNQNSTFSILKTYPQSGHSTSRPFRSLHLLLKIAALISSPFPVKSKSNSQRGHSIYNDQSNVATHNWAF